MSPDAILDTARDFITRWGYPAIAGFALTEAIVLVVPSQLTLPFFGFLAGRGDLDLTAVIALATVFGTISPFPWFITGRCLSRSRIDGLVTRYGGRFGVTTDTVAALLSWFQRRGIWAIVIGRFAPGTRTWICLIAGIAGVSTPRFSIACLIGTFIWTAALTCAGAVLGQNFEVVATYLGQASKVLLLVILIVVIVLVTAWIWRRRQNVRSE